MVLAAGNPDHDRVERKLTAIEEHRVPRGSVVTFTAREINAWVAVEAPKAVPEGLRQPHVELGEGTATGSALVDFQKMQQAKGQNMSWLMNKLLQGERPVSVTVEIRSADGQATVFLRSVQISGLDVSGGVLEFLVKTFFMPLYPDARIDQPFELDYNIERMEVHPDRVLVKIKK